MFWRHLLIIFLLVGWFGKDDELEILIGKKTRKVDSRERQEQIYYELKDLAGLFELKSEETTDQLTLTGPRGKLILNDGRPLIRFADQYILHTLPVWKRKGKNWYVPEDFLTKSLPLILTSKIEKIGDRRYRVESLKINQVQVKVSNYPDHVRVVIQPSQKTPVRVKEFRTYIQLEFGAYLVQPEYSLTQPDRRIVSALEFDSKDVYGTFRIHKGDYYYNFREFNLSDPDRKVLDIYAPPAAARKVEKEVSAPEPVITDVPTPPALARPTQRESGLIFQRRLPQNVVTIDPGHGGANYGVQPSQDILEKNFALKIAGRIEQRLGGTGYYGLLTRRRDIDLPNEQRSSVGNYYKSKAYISIHTGGSPVAETHGPVVYVHRYLTQLSKPSQENGLVRWEDGQRNYLDQSRRLGELIQGELNNLYGTENKVVEVPLAVLAPVSTPAVLVETGFLTNVDDREKLSLADFQDQIARAVATAVLKFLKAS